MTAGAGGLWVATATPAGRRLRELAGRKTAQGCVPVPEGPGLGVELDWAFINAHKTAETVFE